MGFIDEDKIVIKNIHDSKGYGNKKTTEFPGKGGLSCSIVSTRDKSIV